MRLLQFAAAITATSIAASAHAQGAGSAQIAPVRVEFTRPGGTPGSARAVATPPERYMIAPAQPDVSASPKKRKHR